MVGYSDIGGGAYLDVWMCGCSASWMCGYLDMWILDMWLLGYVDVRIRG